MKRSSKERITSAKHSLISTSVFAVLVLMGSASKLESATITWTGLQKTSNTGKATDLYKQFIVGKVVDAAYVEVPGHKADPVPPVIINDTVNSRKISFRALDTFGPGNLTGGPFDTGDTSFNGMMKIGYQHPGNLIQLTIIGLTSGTDYTVQFWSISENMQLGGNVRTTGEACCGVSWYDVGTFTADAPTQVMTLGTKGRTAWNAFLVTVATRPEPKATKDKPTKPVVAKANKPVAAKAKPQPIVAGGPKRGDFLPQGVEIHVHGDLVISDPVNRRGGLREKRYTPRHYFAMLPHGKVRYHGAPADIRDIPPGTHMHGRFLPPMEGAEETIPLTEELLKRDKKYGNTHAILLEDDVSFYSRQGRSWKVLGFEQGSGPAPRLKLSVEPVGPEIDGGINKPALFDIDDSTRIWKNRQLVGRDQIKPGIEVQANFTWGPFDSLAITDIWLDETSLAANKEIQRQRHLKYNRPTKPVVTTANKPVAAKAEPQAIIGGGPKRGAFPPQGAGIHVHGDLVISDRVNRRGALRQNRHTPRHYFAMLPYGMVRYHGAPADMRDIPPGTHMHGRFLPPMEGEEETIPLTEKLLKRDKKYGNNHAILLEDDVSFYSRQGRSWKVLGFEQGGGPAPRLKLSVEPVGPEIEGGINKPAMFDIDDSTRIWKDRQLVNRDQIKPGMEVQANFTRGPFDNLAITDIWLDETSLAANKEIQRQRHLKHIRSHWLPGWVNAVKNYDTGGGEFTVTFFGGMDPELYDEIRKSQNVRVCNATNTLRSWGYHQEYAPHASVLERKEIKDPPPGSSDLQVRVKVKQMLEGFRPGWVVRVKGPWSYVLIPHDEFIDKPEDIERSKKMILP